jgi:hypothetical protein
MFCHVCGHENPDNATSCGKCGATFVNPYQAPAAQAGVPTKINNWLVPAILATLCCCLPFGIVSIVYAAQVNAKLAGGDVAGAMQSASNARMWFWIAFGLGLLVQIIYFGLVGASIVADANRGAFNP